MVSSTRDSAANGQRLKRGTIRRMLHYARACRREIAVYLAKAVLPAGALTALPRTGVQVVESERRKAGTVERIHAVEPTGPGISWRWGGSRFWETERLIQSPQMPEPGLASASHGQQVAPALAFLDQPLERGDVFGISLRASRRTMRGTRILPMPWPVKSTLIVSREGSQ